MVNVEKRMPQTEELKEKIKNLTEEFMDNLLATGELNDYTFHLRLTPKDPDPEIGFYTAVLKKRKDKQFLMFYDSDGSVFDYLTTIKLSCK